MTFVSAGQQVPVPACEARAVRLRAGRHLRVTDVEGRQVGDLWAFTSDLAEHLSAAHTRVHVDRLFPAVGQSFVTGRRDPILTLVEDRSPGRHDMLVPACDPGRYASLGAPPGHPSCAANLHAALAGQSAPGGYATVPQPVNVFMGVRVGSGGELVWYPASTAPGDSVTFRAETDCLVVVSACPQDLSVVNDGHPTALELRVH